MLSFVTLAKADSIKVAKVPSSRTFPFKSSFTREKTSSQGFVSDRIKNCGNLYENCDYIRE